MKTFKKTLQNFSELKISLSALIFGIVLIVLLSQLSQVLPANLYFSFTSFLYGGTAPGVSEVGILSLLIKMSLPLFAGVALAWFWNAEGTKVAWPAGSFAAILLAWPAIALWYFVVDPVVVDKRNLFLIIYVAYAFSFGYLCKVGALFGEWFRNIKPANMSKRKPMALKWGEVRQTAVAAAVSTTVTLLLRLLAQSGPAQ